eukprot:CAMPEP_0117746524 /NCGR_PEP_ID=MMETSP0947-20121206/7993_1 /TAXON_ID=44440 /ORGANISM="Chattonella subsalsa, Strain CCMP2191" /LENGTH=246 /DNA_ID=CAMNT_0005563855 /DNA_START=138 /DNA_END=875 /DNA_ORIENTATION=-
MPGASWKNAVKRKTHKERSQPAERAKKYGLLEKKKDYLLRARDYHKKEDKIMHLRRKAAMRNPDEFYFGMNDSKTKGGIHALAATNSEALPVDMVKLLKTQDVAYLTMKKAIDDKKAARLKSTLHGLVEEPLNKHTIFLDSNKDASQFDPVKHFNTVPELGFRAYNRPRKETLEASEVLGVRRTKDLKRVLKKRDRTYLELQERQQRAEKLEKTVLHIQTQKNLMGKGRKYKVKEAQNGNPAVFKW